MQLASYGTKLEQEKAYAIFDDMTKIAFECEYDELMSHVMLKDKCNCYSLAAKITLHKFK